MISRYLKREAQFGIAQYTLIIFFILTQWVSVPLYAYETALRITDREIVESLSELKQGQKHLSQRIDDQIHSTDKRFEEMNSNIDKRFEEMNSNIDKRFEAMNNNIDKRFEAMNNDIDKRFKAMNETMDQKFEAMNETMDQKFEAMNEIMDQKFEAIDQRFEAINETMNQRFEAIDQRLDAAQNLILTLYGSSMAVLLVLLGYMIWDRRTAQKPVREKIRNIEHRFAGVDDHFSEIDDHLEIRNPSGPVLARLMSALRQLAETNPDVAGVLRSFSLL